MMRNARRSKFAAKSESKTRAAKNISGTEAMPIYDA
jgi:hypothetical protein